MSLPAIRYLIGLKTPKTARSAKLGLEPPGERNWRIYIMIAKHEDQVCYFVVWNKRNLPRKSLPLSAFVHVSAASYKAARSSVILCLSFNLLETQYITAAPAYFAVSLCAKEKLPTILEASYENNPDKSISIQRFNYLNSWHICGNRKYLIKKNGQSWKQETMYWTLSYNLSY